MLRCHHGGTDWRPLLLLGLGMAARSSSAASLSASSAAPPCGLLRTNCTLISFDDAVEAALSNGDGCETREDARRTVASYCTRSVCQSPVEADQKDMCTSDGFHGFLASFTELTTKRNSLMWPVFFLIGSVLTGAFFRTILPKWMPYTVFLLVVGILFGAIGNLLAWQHDCPMFALLHDVNGNGLIEPDEWNEFTCVNCVAQSFCLTAQSHVGGEYAATCGDGTPPPVHLRRYRLSFQPVP